MTATLRTSQESAPDAQADVIVVGVVQGPDGPVPAPGAEDVDAALGGNLAQTLGSLGATGKAEEVTRIASAGKLTAPLIAAVGIGGPAGGQAPFGGEALRRAAGAAVRAVTNGTPLRVALALPARDAAEAEAVALGALLGGYTFGRYTGKRQDTEVIVLGAAAEATDRARLLAGAMTLVRDLVNTGPSDLYPSTFAAEAERVAGMAGLDVEILDEKALAEGGYGGLTGVGQGSVHPPRMARVAYTHPDATKTVVLVGKGITFDSGGLSLKPPKSMEAMKSDMSGAAAVLAAVSAVAQLAAAVNVVGYLCMAENMPSGTAQRPSDVITIYGGRTVEVLNTDAEGRLVMADGLARSAADSPDLLIDVATLTGAQLVALGPRIMGVMANDDAVLRGVVDAADRAGEAAWPMPLPDELRKGLDSPVADIANVTQNRDGGMLVGGLFLREFVPDGVRWAHLDIAGPAFHEGEPYGYTPKGGTGAAVRLLVQVALDVADGRL
ncbi:MAG TPA: leucyl aminopeptidase [Streptosporangiaceae bacterium]|nr:leucyl aminopeptidase [Streptosporangiaceae bacterium]